MKKQSNPQPNSTMAPPQPPSLRYKTDWPDTIANRVVFGLWAITCALGLISLAFINNG